MGQKSSLLFPQLFYKWKKSNHIHFLRKGIISSKFDKDVEQFVLEVYLGTITLENCQVNFY
jgi:hypothetical protein